MNGPHRPPTSTGRLLLTPLVIPQYKSSSASSTSPSSRHSSCCDALDLATPVSSLNMSLSDYSLMHTKQSSSISSRPELHTAQTDFTRNSILDAPIDGTRKKQDALARPFRALWTLVKKVPTWYADEIIPKVGMRSLIGTRKEGGARTAETAAGTVVLMSRPVDARNPLLNDVVRFGQSRHAAELIRQSHDLTLGRRGYNGRIVPIAEGWYSFIIDQRDRLLVNFWGGAGGAHGIKGAHANLSAGLPVLFAGELKIEGDRVVSVSARSGSYRTPARLLSVALAQPLLAHAQAVDVID